MPTMPIKKTLAKKLPAKAAAAPRRPRDDDEEAEAAPPRPVKKAAAKSTASGKPAKKAVEEGWDGGDNQKGDPNFVQTPQVEKGETFVFKFIGDKPYANLRTHWVERKGKMSFVCPQDDECPLCALGIESKSDHRFNIAMLGEEGPVLRSLNVGVTNYNEFKGFHNDPRHGPLSRRFYARTRPSGKGGRWKTEMFKRDSDLEEEFPNLYIPSDDEIAALGAYTKADAEKEINRKELQDIADEISDDYEDED